MPYYRGDYYRGDYYRGDPFIGPLIAAVGGVATKVLPALVKKGVSSVGNILRKPGVGTAIATVGGVAGGRASSGGALLPPPPPFANGGSMVPRPGIKGKIQRLLPFGETGYYRRRRMNPANVKALRRAIRRAQGFERLAKQVGRFLQPGKNYQLKARKKRACR